ncbi:hypothetical protein LDENG_00196430 [Lucifuga dentata]|nr:hypothetical protein LDENG_00196430 [Lucifuga dentata]
MGCGSSKTTGIQAIGDEDDTGSKYSSRGDSAVSKVTTDSGVVMENREIPMLPGAVPTKLPALTAIPGLLQQESTALERPKSSEILEELLSQGIITVDQPKESGSGAGEAYSIMLDDREGARRRPPARLESLKAIKEQSPTSREAIDEKMRLAEERRKLREDELKTRLRTKSARVRGPAPTSAPPQEEDAALTSVELLQTPLTPDPAEAPASHKDPQELPLHTQVREATHRAAKAGEPVREAGGDSREGGGGGGGGGGTGNKEGRGERTGEEGMTEGSERVSGNGGSFVGQEEEEEEEEKVNQVEELKSCQLLRASWELESDSTFQHVDDNGEIF